MKFNLLFLSTVVALIENNKEEFNINVSSTCKYYDDVIISNPEHLDTRECPCTCPTSESFPGLAFEKALLNCTDSLDARCYARVQYFYSLESTPCNSIVARVDTFRFYYYLGYNFAVFEDWTSWNYTNATFEMYHGGGCQTGTNSSNVMIQFTKHECKGPTGGVAISGEFDRTETRGFINLLPVLKQVQIRSQHDIDPAMTAVGFYDINDCFAIPGSEPLGTLNVSAWRILGSSNKMKHKFGVVSPIDDDDFLVTDAGLENRTSCTHVTECGICGTYEKCVWCLTPGGHFCMETEDCSTPTYQPGTCFAKAFHESSILLLLCFGIATIALFT